MKRYSLVRMLSKSFRLMNGCCNRIKAINTVKIFYKCDLRWKSSQKVGNAQLAKSYFPTGKFLFPNWEIIFFQLGCFYPCFWMYFCSFLIFICSFLPNMKIWGQVKIFDMSHWVSCRTLHATSLLSCYKTDFISRLSCVLQFTTHSRKRKYIRDSFGRTGDFC